MRCGEGEGGGCGGVVAAAGVGEGDWRSSEAERVGVEELAESRADAGGPGYGGMCAAMGVALARAPSAAGSAVRIGRRLGWLGRDSGSIGCKVAERQDILPSSRRDVDGHSVRCWETVIHRVNGEQASDAQREVAVRGQLEQGHSARVKTLHLLIEVEE